MRKEAQSLPDCMHAHESLCSSRSYIFPGASLNIHSCIKEKCVGFNI